MVYFLINTFFERNLFFYFINFRLKNAFVLMGSSMDGFPLLCPYELIVLLMVGDCRLQSARNLN